MSKLTVVKIGNATPAGSPFTANRYINAQAFKLVITGTGVNALETSGAGITIISGRFQNSKGANIVAANDLTLGLDGNVFTVTGNTQITAITTINWQSGPFVILETTGTPLFKHNTAGGAGTLPLKLAGSVDYQAAVDDAILFYNNGSFWHELARKQAGQGGRYNFLNYLTESGNTVKLGGLGVDAITTLTAAEKQILITFNSLAGASGLKLTSTYTLASGSAHKLLEILLSGANVNSGAATYGIYVENIHTGASSTNFGVAGIANSGSSNIGVYGESSAGDGVKGVGTTGRGATFISDSFYGMLAQSTTGIAGRFVVLPSSTNTAIEVLRINRQTTGTPAAGIGGYINFALEANAVGASEREAAKIVVTFTDVTDGTRTSTLKFTGVLSAAVVDLLTLASNGSVKWRPITASAASAITPAEGMIVFTSDTDATFTSIGFWGYENGTWNKL